MPLPVIANDWQVTLLWSSTAAQRPATNTLHFHDTSGAGTAAGLYTALNANVAAGMWELVSSTAAIQQVKVTKLDGTSATVTNATGTPAKWSGSGGADPILQGAAVVTLRSASRGKSHRGRIYLPFIGETGQASGTLTPANVANMQAAWEAWLTAMKATIWQPYVVSPKNASDDPITSIQVQPYLKSQRRRQRR